MSAEREKNGKERLPIEAQGRRSANRQTHLMLTNSEPIETIISLADADYLDLLRLGTTEEDSGGREPFTDDVKYNRITGAISTTFWVEMELHIDPATGKNTIENAADYMYIQDRDDARLKNLPKNAQVKRMVVVNMEDGAEPAIRREYHIQKRHDPASIDAEPQRQRRILRWVEDTSREIREGSITEERLDELSSQGALLIEDAGLDSAVNKTKKKLAQMIRNATRKDSRLRINPMISRIRLRSALLQATRRIVASDLIRRKSQSNLEVLVEEREYTRYVLEQAYKELSSIMDVARGLEFKPSQVTKEERELLASQITEIAYQYLPIARVAPYLVPSREAALYLVEASGKSRRERRKKIRQNKQILARDVEGNIYSMAPATKLLRSDSSEAHKIAGSRIRWAAARLRFALDLEENNNLTPSDKKVKAAEATSSYESVTQTVFDINNSNLI